MAKEIIINAEAEQTRIAIVDQGELVELFIENPEHERTIGDIYLGRVRRIMPSIKAAFVDIGQKQDAFLHFSDLAENLEALLDFVDQDHPQVSAVGPQGEAGRSKGVRRRPSNARAREGEAAKNQEKEKKAAEADPKTRGQARAKRRSVQQRSKHKNQDAASETPPRRNDKTQRSLANLLKRDQRILVKIVKEPISNKGSRVSTNISLAGRFLVLVPLADYTAVSKKIYSHTERRRLRALAKSLLPEGFGVIVRTVAQGRDAKTLDIDLRLLLEKWRKIEKRLSGRPGGPMKIHEDVNMASSIIRDLFSEDYDRILVDQPRLHRNIKSYIQAVAPQMKSAVHLYKGKRHIFEATKLDRIIEEIFESRVDLPSGGYLFIERTEAMHVIDVNSGRSGRGMNQEENSLKVNLEAARTLARQVRLRDLGGIIVVDFIDLKEERNKKKVHDALKKAFRTDRAVTKILPMSDFGLVQITRQRLRPSITTTFSASEGASTNGTDSKASDASPKEKAPPAAAPPPPVQAVAPPPKPKELVKEMEQWVATYKAEGKRNPVTLRVHPFTAAYLNHKLPAQPTRWFLKYRVRIHVETDGGLDPLTYHFIDAQSGQDITEASTNGTDSGTQKKSGKPAS